jgi:hypothetical protein
MTSHVASGSRSSWLVSSPGSRPSDHYPADHISEVLSVFIEVKAASGEIEPNSGVVREIITSALDFRYQRYTPEGTLGEFGVSLQLQSAAMVTLDNLGNMVSIIQGEVKEDRNEALDSLLKTLRNWAMDFADMMDKKDKRLAEQNQRESELGE